MKVWIKTHVSSIWEAAEKTLFRLIVVFHQTKCWRVSFQPLPNCTCALVASKHSDQCQRHSSAGRSEGVRLQADQFKSLYISKHHANSQSDRQSYSTSSISELLLKSHLSSVVNAINTQLVVI